MPTWASIRVVYYIILGGLKGEFSDVAALPTGCSTGSVASSALSRYFFLTISNLHVGRYHMCDDVISAPIEFKRPPIELETDVFKLNKKNVTIAKYGVLIYTEIWLVLRKLWFFKCLLLMMLIMVLLVMMNL